MWRMVRNPESDRSSGVIVETVAGNRSGVTNKVLDPFNLIAALPSFRPAPACCRQAGMTTRRERTGCYPDSAFAIPDKRLTAAPAVIPAKAGIQWFNNSFSRSGNDNRRDNRTRAFGKTCHPFTIAPPPSWIPRPSFQTRLYHLHPCRRACACLLQAGRNDDGGKSQILLIPFVITVQQKNARIAGISEKV